MRQAGMTGSVAVQNVKSILPLYSVSLELKFNTICCRYKSEEGAGLYQGSQDGQVFPVFAQVLSLGCFQHHGMV